MNAVFIRPQDYWVFPLSAFSVLMIDIFLYAGVFWMRAAGALLGFPVLLFIYYIIRKNYEIHKARRYAVIVLAVSFLTSFSAYLLTK